MATRGPAKPEQPVATPGKGNAAKRGGTGRNVAEKVGHSLHAVAVQPLKPRPKLLAILAVVFAAWVGFLVTLYFKTGKPRNAAPDSAPATEVAAPNGLFAHPYPPTSVAVTRLPVRSPV